MESFKVVLVGDSSKRSNIFSLTPANEKTPSPQIYKTQPKISSKDRKTKREYRDRNKPVTQ